MTPDEARKSVSCLWCGEFFRHRDTYENHPCYRAFLAGQLQGRRAEQMGASYPVYSRHFASETPQGRLGS